MDKQEIGIIVEANDSYHAQFKALTMTMAHIQKQEHAIEAVHGVTGIHLTRSPEGAETIDHLWESQEAIYNIALEIIRKVLSNTNPGVLDDLGFRAACFRIGRLSGFPVKLYDTIGYGIMTKDHLDRVLKGVLVTPPTAPIRNSYQLQLHNPDHLWVVVLEVT